MANLLALPTIAALSRRSFKALDSEGLCKTAILSARSLDG